MLHQYQAEIILYLMSFLSTNHLTIYNLDFYMLILNFIVLSELSEILNSLKKFLVVYEI